MTAEMKDRLLYAGLRTALVVGALVAWEVAADAGIVDAFFYSQPSAAMSQLGEWVTTGYLWPHLTSTVVNGVVGYVIGAILGVVIGWVLAFGPGRTGAVGQQLLILANAVPRLVLAPLFIIWFGTGGAGKVALAVTIVVVIIALNVYSGLMGVDQGLVHAVRIMGANRRQLARSVYLPAIIGWLLSSLRLTLGLAFAASVVAEYMGSGTGLGWVMMHGFGTFNATAAISAMTALFLVVVVLDQALAWMESRATRWRL
jgi:NitT/TauT family transport system permease protein